MDQNLQITNLTQGAISLDGKYLILPGKLLILTVLEYHQILQKIELYKQLGWVSWKFIPVEYPKQNCGYFKETEEVLVNQPILNTEVVAVEEIPVELHPASPLITKRKWTRRVKTEGEIKVDDSKGTI